MNGTYEKVMSNREFHVLITKSLADLPKVSDTVDKISVAGVIETNEGEGALVLETKIHLKTHMKPFETGIAALGPAGSKEEALSLVNRGISDLSHALSNLLKLVGAPEDVLISALDAAEPDEQLMALRILGHSKVRSAVPAIGKLLTDPRIQVSEAAAEALAQIGDEAAVPILISAIKRYDVRSEVRAIEAMGRIGGDEAKAYLEMTATGHDIPEVRRLSKALLEDMK